jgi:hypothetical protein
MTEKSEYSYDVAVIGAGPAGLMAAFSAAEAGAKVVVLERGAAPGRKLLLTGNGRCNLTNVRFDRNTVLEKYGQNGKFLFSGLSKFGCDQTMEFFAAHGLPTYAESDGRVFPVTCRARDVVDVFVKMFSELKVDLKTQSRVLRFEKGAETIEKIVLENEVISAKSVVLCAGGKSRPDTGSTGDGFALAESLGHGIVPVFPSIVPLVSDDAIINGLQGVCLEDVKISYKYSDKPFETGPGEIIFTHSGISGPLVLNTSRVLSRLLASGPIEIRLDLVSWHSYDEADNHLLAVFGENPNKTIVNCIGTFLPDRMVEAVVNSAGVEIAKPANSVTKAERQAVVSKLKSFPLKITGTAGFEASMAATGGVQLGEVDPKTMGSRLVKNLFLAGELLDLDGLTGGYNLQMCWTTGYVAGESAAGNR